MHYQYNIEAFVVSWLETDKDGKPKFQKRTYKNLEAFIVYLENLFLNKGNAISNVHVKVCYDLFKE